MLKDLSHGIVVDPPQPSEDIISYIRRRSKGEIDLTLYRQIIGAANAFKEGDQFAGVAAADDASRLNARKLLAQTRLDDINRTVIFHDDIAALIEKTTTANPSIGQWRLAQLKTYVLTQSEAVIKAIMPSLTSDIIGCLVKLMTNDELIRVGQTIFNPLPGSRIGSQGYMGARIQPNSPTDNCEDIIWQVFDGWAYGVGDLVLGTNPVSSERDSVARIEHALFEIIKTFELEEALPHCVLSHIDVQAEVEAIYPETTGIWFQSLAGTVAANQTFNISIEKMLRYADQRTGRYGLYAETGQGADGTNGHDEGFDMVIHESRKYGFLRAIKATMLENSKPGKPTWVFVNDVAGFIGPEVFRTKEQLVRCCLEDIAMGKLHGLTIGLDICSTLHMDIDLDDLDWCINQIMPANPAYLMALPTKNDPMLSYITTSFSDHVRIRHQFGYKVNDVMWEFFKKIGILSDNGTPTRHFGDPIWVYYHYCLSKKDSRSRDEIYADGQDCLARIRSRGVPISEGHGENPWNLPSDLEREIRCTFEDSKKSLWMEMPPSLIKSIPGGVPISTQSLDRKNYINHPESGEKLSDSAVITLKAIRSHWATVPDIQIVISDGLSVNALTDDGHLNPFLGLLLTSLTDYKYTVSPEIILITHGRVRAGYSCGELLFGDYQVPKSNNGIIHIIGERPGSGHHNFSAYITVAHPTLWLQKGQVDHDISRVISGISDTALLPKDAVKASIRILDQLFDRVR